MTIVQPKKKSKSPPEFNANHAEMILLKYKNENFFDNEVKGTVIKASKNACGGCHPELTKQNCKCVGEMGPFPKNWNKPEDVGDLAVYENIEV